VVEKEIVIYVNFLVFGVCKVTRSD